MEIQITLALTEKEVEALKLTLAQASHEGMKTVTLIENLSSEMAEENRQPVLNQIKNYLNTINGVLNRLELINKIDL